MNMYLRDFINDNVGPECGGNASIVNPSTIQMKLNECLRRLDRLEAGIGFTLKIRDQVTLPFTLVGDTLTTMVPSSGTINLVTVLSDKAGAKDGLDVLTITINQPDGKKIESTHALNHKEKVHTVLTSLEVHTGEWIEITAEPYSYEAADTPIISSAQPVACFALLQLPEQVYGVGNAGS